MQEIFYHTIFIYERTASIKNTFSRFSEKREVSVARIHLVKNSGTRANGSSMEFRGGLSAIASPRTVLSGRCNGEPIVSPLMPRMRTTIAVRDEPSTFTAWWLMVLRASRNSIEPRAIHSRIRKRTRISKSWETGIFKRKMLVYSRGWIINNLREFKINICNFFNHFPLIFFFFLYRKPVLDPESFLYFYFWIRKWRKNPGPFSISIV